MKYITIKSAAKLLGVHRMTIYRYIAKGIIPAKSVGKGFRFYIPIEAIPDFLKKEEQKLT